MALTAAINKKGNEDSKVSFLLRNGLVIVLVVAFAAFAFIAQSSSDDSPAAEEHSHLKTIHPQSIDENTDGLNDGVTTDPTDDEAAAPSPASTSPHDEEKVSGNTDAWTRAMKEKFGGDLLDRGELVRLAKLGKEKLIADLRVAYGEYFDDIFIGEGKTYTPISSGGGSMDRLKRKFMIKALSVQQEVRMQQSLASGASERDLVEVDDYFGRYVWATGGHSASAGHGNLFNESYTAYMGSDVRKVFGAVGLYFEDRNYAMGGTASASEISMCWAQVFGTDVDFFSWDYGMTDGTFPARLLHYAYRGGLSPGQPAIMGIRIGGRSGSQRHDALRDLEKIGMATFEGTDSSYALRNAAIPDSGDITEEEIQSLPPMLQNLKCGSGIEAGEPYCGREKYTSYVCPRRSKQTSWHPGFKAHALDGHAISLFLVDAFIEALEDLAENDNQDGSSLLEQLQQEEESTFGTFREGELPPIAWSLFDKEGGATQDETLDLEFLWKGPSLCRTGRLPAESRYLGYTTNSEKVGGITVLGREKYDLGITISDAKKPDAMSNGIQLTYEPGGKEREKCEVVLKPDYKDFFYLDDGHGRASLTIPNAKEAQAYKYDPEQFKGYIILFFVACSWGKCPTGQLRPEDFVDGKFEVSVNGKPAVGLLSLGFDAMILKGESGMAWEPNDHGLFDIALEVKDKGYLMLSSFVIY
eukprot:Nitzschia sp. Nitz4//scaffold38_size140716//136095//138256//NITZ4_003180-RA/size140716-processed-gene-0.49-mRNA-1//1//CDS//3329550177//3254//frame0